MSGPLPCCGHDSRLHGKDACTPLGGCDCPLYGPRAVTPLRKPEPVAAGTVRSVEIVAHARRTDPETSHDAAQSVTGIRESQARVLAVLRAFPAGLTDEELYDQLVREWAQNGRTGRRWTASGARTRRSELVTRGDVFDTGHRRKTAAGRQSIVWRAAERKESAA